MPLMYVLHATNSSPPLHRLPMYLVQLHQSLARAGERWGAPKRTSCRSLPCGLRSFTRCKTFRMGLIRLFLSVHTQDHAPRCVIVPAFFCCRATAAADGAEARVQRLPALRVLTQCALLPHDLSARQGRPRVALILAKRCNSSSHDVSERAQRRGGASPSLPATIHHLPLAGDYGGVPPPQQDCHARCRTQLGRRRP